jgi:hypothetical protein
LQADAACIGHYFRKQLNNKDNFYSSRRAPDRLAMRAAN